MRKLFCLTIMVAFCLTLFSYVPVNAQEQAEFKVAPVGSVFKFKVTEPGLFSDDISEREMTVLSVDGITITYQMKTPKSTDVRDWKAFTVGINSRENITQENMDKIKGLFPLKVGNKTAFKYSGCCWTSPGDVEIVKIEEVTVPSGTFKTFVIKTTMTNLPSFSGTRISWYSPEIGWVVKTSWVASRQRGTSENMIYELKSYTLKK